MPDIKPAPPEYQNQSPATPAQIALYAKGAGFPDGEIATAVAVALAESGGKLAAISPVNSDGTRDYGLWQINSVHARLFEENPTWWRSGTNARMAYQVWSGSGWRAWTTYTSGEYKDFLDEGERVKDTPGEVTGTADTTREAEWFREFKEVAVQIGNGIAAIAQAVFKTAVWLSDPHNWVRAALVGLGGSLLVGALVIVSKPQTTVVQAVQAAPRAAGSVATRTAKAVG